MAWTVIDYRTAKRLQIDHCALGDEQFNRIRVAILRCSMKRSVTFFPDCLQIGAVLDECFNHGPVSFEGCHGQGCSARF